MEISDADALIFDYDLTLVDSRKAIVELYSEVCKKYGGSAEKLDFKTMFGMLDDEAIPYACECAKPNISSEEFRKIVHEMEPIYSLKAPLLIDAECLRGLKQKGKRLFIVTNNISNNVCRNLKEKGIYDLFEQIICADNFGDFKCKSEVISDVGERFNLRKDQILYVGDHLNDVNYAKKAGVKVLGVATGFHTEEELGEEGADFVASRFEGV